MPDWLTERQALAAAPLEGAFEVPPESIDGQPIQWPRHTGDFPLWPENQHAWEFFRACETQWQHAGMGGVKVGLNYAGVETVARVRGPGLTRERFAELQTMESAAMGAWADQAKEDEDAKK